MSRTSPGGPPRKVSAALANTALLLAIGLLGACSTVPAPETRADAADEAAPRIMVTLPSSAPFPARATIGELAVTYGLEVVAVWKMESLDQQCVVFESRSSRSPERLIRSLSHDPRIDLAQPISRFRVLGTGTAAQTRPATETRAPTTETGTASENRSYRRFQHAADTLRLEEAHTLATGRGVKLAVVDTGVDLGHPELGERVVAARDFVGPTPHLDAQSFTRDLHGTAVAGLIASSPAQDLGILGVAPGVDLMALKACWAEPAGGRAAVCDSYTLAQALDFAVNAKAQIINLSLSGPEEPILRKLLEIALADGIVIVAATAPESEPSFPASMEGTLAVTTSPIRDGAERPPVTAPPGTLPPARSLLSAPGEEILTTSPGGGYDFWNGSSMSAAQVAGIAALMLEADPELGPSQVADLLHVTAHRGPGAPVVDACAAVARAGGGSCGR